MMSFHLKAERCIPFALASSIIPWHKNITGFDMCPPFSKLLADLCQQLVELGLVDDRNSINNNDVVEAFFSLNLISEGPQCMSYAYISVL